MCRELTSPIRPTTCRTFYELFALWADEEDRPFFKEAAKVSRGYLAKACHEKTGMSAEYAEFDGQPMSRPLPWTTDRHDWFFSDAYRTVANIGLDYEWFGIDEGQYDAPEKAVTVPGCTVGRGSLRNL